MQDDKTRGGNSRDGGIKADSSWPEFRRVTAELDVEERIEMGIQRRALERFKNDDDDGYEPITPKRSFDFY